MTPQQFWPALERLMRTLTNDTPITVWTTVGTFTAPPLEYEGDKTLVGIGNTVIDVHAVIAIGPQVKLASTLDRKSD